MDAPAIEPPPRGTRRHDEELEEGGNAQTSHDSTSSDPRSKACQPPHAQAQDPSSKDRAQEKRDSKRKDRTPSSKDSGQQSSEAGSSKKGKLTSVQSCERALDEEIEVLTKLPLLILMSPRLLEKIASEYIHRTKRGEPIAQDNPFIKGAEELLYKLWDACRFPTGTTPGYMTTESHHAHAMALGMHSANTKRLFTEGMKDGMFGFGKQRPRKTSASTSEASYTGIPC
jgi:hypothetical protein